MELIEFSACTSYNFVADEQKIDAIINLANKFTVELFLILSIPHFIYSNRCSG